MKKFFILIGIILVVIVVFPKHITKGGGHILVREGTVIHTQVCYGFYLETYNENPVDGDRGGYCFGIVGNKYGVFYTNATK